MVADIQRIQVSEFLKGCRARLSPSQVGLPEPDRRRTPGLRREDVAVLVGVSVTWYTWLEQGRQISVSADLLERVSSTLQLSPDEREYLFALVQGRSAPLLRGPTEECSPRVRRMLDALSLPALVMTNRWDVVAWNELVARIFRDYSKLEPENRNLLKILLMSPEYRSDPVEYETIARRVLAKFRVDYSQSAGDPAFEALIEELDRECEAFRRLWPSAEIRSRTEGVHVARHVQLGGLTFEHSSYVPEGSRNLRVIIFVPHDEESERKVASIGAGIRRQVRGDRGDGNV